MNRLAIDLVDALRADDHVVGPDEAPVVVMEYGDFECPNCKQAASAMKILLSRFEKRVRFAFRHYPLEEVHPHAWQAAEAAECAGAQGRFWEMHDVLFDCQSHLELLDLQGYAEHLGLDTTRFAAEMDGHIHLPRIRAHIEGGKRSGVRGTPGFFINGTIQDVSFGLRSLFEATEAEFERRR